MRVIPIYAIVIKLISVSDWQEGNRNIDEERSSDGKTAERLATGKAWMHMALFIAEAEIDSARPVQAS